MKSYFKATDKYRMMFIQLSGVLLLSLLCQVSCCPFAKLESENNIIIDTDRDDNGVQPKQKRMLSSTGTVGSTWTFDEMMQVMAKLRTVWASPTAAYREWSSIHGDIECYKLHPTQPTGLVCNSTEFSDYVSDKY